MRILILHNVVAADAAPEDRDVLEQVHAVASALRELGHDFATLACSLNLETVSQKLAERSFDGVFNLVESLGGSDWLMYLVPALLDTLGVPYTGAKTTAIFRTTHKLLAKRELAAAGIPTPRWQDDRAWNSPLNQPASGTFIVKAISEHASIGLDERAILKNADAATLRRAAADFAARTGKPAFAEEFIDGREFNLSLLDGPHGPEVLPVAEIEFVDFADGAARFVDYNAKWNVASSAYQNTPRRFNFPESDESLLGQLREIALRCWRLFEMSGYARVDFRVDRDGQPFVLEVNANPCLSPDAGYFAALQENDIAFAAAIERILGAVNK